MIQQNWIADKHQESRRVASGRDKEVYIAEFRAEDVNVSYSRETGHVQF